MVSARPRKSERVAAFRVFVGQVDAVDERNLPFSAIAFADQPGVAALQTQPRLATGIASARKATGVRMAILHVPMKQHSRRDEPHGLDVAERDGIGYIRPRIDAQATQRISGADNSANGG